MFNRLALNLARSSARREQWENPMSIIQVEQLESRALLSAGSMDPSYHPALNNAPVSYAFEDVVLMQLDGKSIHYAPLKKQTLWRENPNGSLDKSFGSKGKVFLAGDVEHMAIAPDGNIVVVYRRTGAKRLRLVRYTAAGKLDRTFGGSGELNLAIHDRFY